MQVRCAGRSPSNLRGRCTDRSIHARSFAELTRALQQREDSELRLQLPMDAAHLGSWQYDPFHRVVAGDMRYSRPGRMEGGRDRGTWFAHQLAPFSDLIRKRQRHVAGRRKEERDDLGLVDQSQILAERAEEIRVLAERSVYAETKRMLKTIVAD